jgi:putative transcriptional regulator
MRRAGSSRCDAPAGGSNAYGYRERRAIARNVADDPDAPPILTEGETVAAIVRTMRKRLGLSQAEFAARFHGPVGTLRDWEQNRRQPDAPALAYLRVIAREPEMVARALIVA